MLARSNRLSVLTVDTNPERRARLTNAILGGRHEVDVHHVEHLTAAYHFAEHHLPDIVMLSGRHQNLPGFSMFISMISSYAVDWFLFEDRTCHGPPRHKQIDLSQFQKPGELGDFIAEHHSGAHQSSNTPVSSMDMSGPAPPNWKTVFIGASTGGIDALLTLLSRYPVQCPPTLIVQHLRPNFVPGFADRLDRYCPAKVRLAQPRDRIKPGVVLVAPGGDRHMSIAPSGEYCRLSELPCVEGHRPSIDVLFKSAAALGHSAVGVLLTGMGRDGAQGLAEIRENGGHTIVQDRATSTVFGMPRAAIELGIVQQQVPIEHITQAILSTAANSKTPVFS